MCKYVNDITDLCNLGENIEFNILFHFQGTTSNFRYEWCGAEENQTDAWNSVSVIT